MCCTINLTLAASETHEWPMIKYMTACIVHATVPLLGITFICPLMQIKLLNWSNVRKDLLSSWTHSDPFQQHLFVGNHSYRCLRRREIKNKNYFDNQSSEVDQRCYNIFKVRCLLIGMQILIRQTKTKLCNAIFHQSICVSHIFTQMSFSNALNSLLISYGIRSKQQRLISLEAT